MLSRRTFFAASAAAVAAVRAQAAANQIPVGLEMFSVRNELQKDLKGTLASVAGMGYQGVEFFAPYYEWTPEQAKDVRKQLDSLSLRCFSTHNGPKSFQPDNYAKTIELNNILGSKIVVMASAGRVQTLDDWKRVADTLNKTAAAIKSAGLGVGYHNHQLEFKPLEGGTRPMEILASGTTPDITLQLDVGTCIEAGVDPVEWINKNPGRIRSLHLKDWGREPDKGYKVLFGDGVAPWKQIFAAAEKKGGVQYYLIEQEGSALPPFDTAQKCLETFKKMRA